MNDVTYLIINSNNGGELQSFTAPANASTEHLTMTAWGLGYGTNDGSWQLLPGRAIVLESEHYIDGLPDGEFRDYI